MKYRLVELLQCPCGRNSMALENAALETVPFPDSLTEVKCANTCAFKKCSASDGSVRPSDCNTCYTHEITQGLLRCECGQIWPIQRGIPRFLPASMAVDIKKTQDTFSYEWKMFRFGERNWGQTISFRKDQFLRGMAVAPSDLKGKLMFDAGCGSGLLSIEMAKGFGLEVVALDLAFGIENAYIHNTSPYVYFVQGSVLDPPFRRRLFDYLYCCGVLVACPDTKTGFDSIINTLKDGGRCFTWYYHPINSTYYPTAWRKLAVYNWIRTRITSRLPIRLQYYLYLSWLPAFFVKQRVDVLLKGKASILTWREKMQAWFDFFSAMYQHRHEPSEVISWYKAKGLSNATVAYQEYEGFAIRGDLQGS